jgi:hypothetical protein
MAALREPTVKRRNLRHARTRLFECRYELALRRRIPSPSVHPMLTSDVCCTSSWYSITSKLYLVPRKGRVHRMGVLPTFRESYPSSKLLQAQDSTIWWTKTCPWHDKMTTLQPHSSTMLSTCLLQLHCAIYSRSRALGSWRSDDTITMWSWDL